MTARLSGNSSWWSRSAHRIVGLGKMRLIRTYGLVAVAALWAGCVVSENGLKQHAQAVLDEHSIGYHGIYADTLSQTIRLNLRGSNISDLSILRGLRLTWIVLDGCTNVVDLSPLASMPLVAVSIAHTRVRDLSPLSGKAVTLLFIQDTPVTDLTPLAGMPLEQLKFTPTNITNGMDAIRTKDSLSRINKMTAREFWNSLSKQ